MLLYYGMLRKDNLEDAYNIASDFLDGEALDAFSSENDMNFAYKLGVYEGANLMLSYLYDMEDATDSDLEIVDMRLRIYRKNMETMLEKMHMDKSFNYFEGMTFSINLIGDLIQE